MIGHPDRTEAAPYYFTYIDKVQTDDILPFLTDQLESAGNFLARISEEQSLFRYEPGKWSIRQVLNHLNDCERVFAMRAMWFARGFDSSLPSFEQEIAAAGAKADVISWADHVEEFRRIRLASISLFKNLPPDAWMKTGIASDNRFTVRAMAYITGGHVEHHVRILRERYLSK